jgi:hypothetical protein
MKKIISFMLLHLCFVSTVLGSSAGFCLKKCTEEFCEQSQENYQQCQDSCRGKYEGLIAKCKLVAKKEGYDDDKINEDAKFSPCLTAHNGDPKSSKDAGDMSGDENQSNDDSKSDDEKVIDSNLADKGDAESDLDAESKSQEEDDSDGDADSIESSTFQEDDPHEDSDDDADDASEETEA